MTNIAEILKYCPKGMKLYSPILGECTLCEIDNNNKYYPIIVEAFVNDERTSIQFTKEGLYLTGCLDSECLLFPSKNRRDWSNFRVPVKKGDIMMEIDGTCPFIASGEVAEDGAPKYICGLNISNEFVKSSGCYWTLNSYIPASEDMKEKLLKAIDNNGYKWDGKNLVKKEHQFKPFDKVLVRDDDNELWATAFYSHKIDGYYPYVTASSMGFKQCIPFEGNEHLVGTSNSPK